MIYISVEQSHFLEEKLIVTLLVDSFVTCYVSVHRSTPLFLILSKISPVQHLNPFIKIYSNNSLLCVPNLS